VSAVTNFTFPFPESNWEELKKFLDRLGAPIEPIPYGFSARHGDAVLNWYSSGKLVIQGNDAADLAEELYLMGLVKTGWTQKSEPRIGADESGKGDYFGPLVIAAALVLPAQEPELIRMGVRDSKAISDIMVGKTAAELEKTLPSTKVVIGPKRYNELHLQMKNVNRLLAWGHARAIENLLEQHPARLAVSDQFGDENLIRDALLQKGKTIKLIQRHRGEDDLAVAAASIIARAEFLARLAQLSAAAGFELPKGASEVIPAGKKLVAKRGPEALTEFAKLHFKTTGKILGRAGS